VRYLFVHSAREWSGSARAFADAARGLAERGHTVGMIVEPESTVERLISQMMVTPQGSPEGTGIDSRSRVQLEALPLRGFWLVATARLRSFLKTFRPDVIFVHTNREHFIVSLACRLGGQGRIVRRVPVGGTLAMGWRGRFATWFTPTCFMFSSERDERSTPLPRRAAERAVVPFGIDLPDIETIEPTTLGSGREYIVCVHDDSSRSRAATAIRTLAMLVPQHPGLRLAILGEGAYDDDLRMQAAALRVLNLITFLGERDDALHVMRNARIGWVVADSDTATYALLDFMSLGVPVLAGERTVAEQYVLSKITGVLLPPDDAHITAATVADLLSNESIRTNMGETARSRVQREYPLDAMIDGYEQAALRIATCRRR
jgi:glycosyltransferase involved in cell wall biosynthesis